MRLRERHRHVHVIDLRGQRATEQRHHEPRVDRVHQDVATLGAEKLGDRLVVRGVQSHGGEAVAPRRLSGALGPALLAVRDDDVLEDVVASGDPGESGSHSTCSNQKDAHGTSDPRILQHHILGFSGRPWPVTGRPWRQLKA